MNKDFAPYPHLKNSYRRQIVEKYLFVAIFEVTFFPRSLDGPSKEAIIQKKVPFFVGTDSDFNSLLKDERAINVLVRKKEDSVITLVQGCYGNGTRFYLADFSR